MRVKCLTLTNPWGVLMFPPTRIKLRNEQGRFFGIIRV